MYNDEQNLYHYTYRKDGSESRTCAPMNESHTQSDGRRPPVEDLRPAKRRRGRTGVKVAALALSCALLGGAAGAGVTWAVNQNGGGTANVNVSARPASQVALKSVDGKTAMTDAEVYAANVNAVVSINTSSTSTNRFGQQVQSASSGSGFVLSGEGYIVTNYHVIEAASAVKVTLYNGDTYDAAIIGGDADYDVAVLKVDGQDLPSVTLGDSDSLNVGDRVLAIGNPLGELTFSMSGGMVSSVNRAINVSGTPFNMIQTDASINPGNSGGPLFNQYGEVVGIVSAKYSSYSTESVEGLGFAIPMNDVMAMIQDIMTNGYVTNKPYLAITGGTLTASMAAQYRYDISTGVFVYHVEEGGAAEKAGLKMGDVIVRVGDTEITTMEDLTVVKKQYSSGDTTPFAIYREGQTITVEVTWDAVPAEGQQQTAEAPQEPQSGGTYNGDINDFFNYFFNGGFNGSSYETSRDAA